MLARATTTVDVHRDADTEDRDGYGDETETPGPPVYEALPFSLIEQTQRRPDTTSGTLVAVTALVGRCDGYRDVREGDRVQDRRDGAWYAVTAVSQPQSAYVVLDKRLELRMTGGPAQTPWTPPAYGLGESPLGGTPA